MNNPSINEAMVKQLDLIGYDDKELAAVRKSIYPHHIEQCYVVPIPNAYYYVCWWPWVKNWHGEIYVGF